MAALVRQHRQRLQLRQQHRRPRTGRDEHGIGLDLLASCRDDASDPTLPFEQPGDRLPTAQLDACPGNFGQQQLQNSGGTRDPGVGIEVAVHPVVRRKGVEPGRDLARVQPLQRMTASAQRAVAGRLEALLIETLAGAEQKAGLCVDRLTEPLVPFRPPQLPGLLGQLGVEQVPAVVHAHGAAAVDRGGVRMRPRQWPRVQQPHAKATAAQAARSTDSEQAGTYHHETRSRRHAREHTTMTGR